MQTFTLTPAIQWLETNMYQNKAFDNNSKQPMLTFKFDHDCDENSECTWERLDEHNEWHWRSNTNEELAEMFMRDMEFGDDEFEYVLEIAQESPFYQSIAQ